MHVYRGLRHPALAPACALTIGNFDGVHRGHQAMIALLRSEAEHRGVPCTVLSFEPHPREFFALRAGKPQVAPPRVGPLRDKLGELARCGVDQVVLLPFTEAVAALPPQQFIEQVLLQGLGARYVLIGDDFRFGAGRAGDYTLLDAAGDALGFEVARMNAYEVHGQRVSSSAVREALAAGRMEDAQRLLGRPYAISGHVVRGAQLGRLLGETGAGRADGFRTLNLRAGLRQQGLPGLAVQGIFVSRVYGLGEHPLEAVSSLGVRPSLHPNDANGGLSLLETHCLDWPANLGPEGGYGKLVRVELLHKLHDERRYAGLTALTAGIQQDVTDARSYFVATRRQTTRDRIQRGIRR